MDEGFASIAADWIQRGAAATMLTPRAEQLALLHSSAEAAGPDFELIIQDELFIALEFKAVHVQTMVGHFNEDRWGTRRLAEALEDLRREEQAARCDLRAAAERLRTAQGAEQGREAARDFLAALAKLVSKLLAFIARVLLLLLSCTLGRTHAEDITIWQPEPIDAAPQITPRGPNPAFPVNTNRGGHHRSTPGSVALAA